MKRGPPRGGPPCTFEREPQVFFAASLSFLAPAFALPLACCRLPSVTRLSSPVTRPAVSFTLPVTRSVLFPMSQTSSVSVSSRVRTHGNRAEPLYALQGFPTG